MATDKQNLGEFGELLVIKHCSCPKCKRQKTLKRLRQNFKCADVVCDFCGYLAQVKAITAKDIDTLPHLVLGAAWSVQKDRLDAGIYMPLFLVQVNKEQNFAIFYLPADLQSPEMFIPRKPLSEHARRKGWQGFMYDLSKVQAGATVRII